MANLSTPIGDLRARYDVVVIGSGYGGAVVARWMAEAAEQRRRTGEAPFSVCLLERGLEIRPGRYPTSLIGALRSAQADTRFGRIGRRTSLFDLRMHRDLTVLIGCGLGGTSLINASVILEPKEIATWPDEALRMHWPEELRQRGALTEEFEEVKKELGAQPMPSRVTLDKVTRLIESAGQDPLLDEVQKAHRPPIAVSFHTHIDKFGVQHERCTLCGNCLTGCNYSAKNTLIMNYLPAAAHYGASIFCGLQVIAVEPGHSQDGDWLVHTRILGRGSRLFGSPEVPIRAGMVFLASGTLGSTEILLRSRDRYRHRLSLSPALGKHFSGNGDVIAFGYNAEKRVNGMGFGAHLPTDAATGPTIAGMLDERDCASGAMIQEGAVPGALGFPLRVVGPIIARLSRLGIATREFSFKAFWREVDSFVRGPHHGALVRTQTFLGMSFDDGRGTMCLSGGRLRIDWPGVGHQRVFTKMAGRLAELTRAMKGSYVSNPIWSRLFGRRLVIAHPLGGCALSDRPADGVVNSFGQVYDVGGNPGGHAGPSDPKVHKGLYVCDGAIIPTPLGTNPSLTIAALALRIAKHAERDIPPAGRQDATGIRHTRPRRIESDVVGLRYSERLRGTMRLDGYDTRVEFFFHMSAENLEQLLTGDTHEVQIVGAARMPDMPNGSRRFTISEGTLNVAIVDHRQVDTRLLVYQLTLTPTDGGADAAQDRTLFVRGHKTINHAACKRGVWKAATRLPLVVYDRRPRVGSALDPYAGCNMVDRTSGAADRRQILARRALRRTGVVGAGLVGNSLVDAVRLIASLEVLHEPRFLKRVRHALRFHWFFLDALIQARVWALRRTDALNPFGRDVNGRPAKTPDKIVRDRNKDTHGNDRYEFVHYQGRRPDGQRPQPVILIPGFSMSTYWFRAPTPGKNITEFLLEHGYDVWLLDYRSSDRLRASLDQFTLDELAASDFPDAIRQVSDATGQPVHVIAHCVGSLTMLMSLLSGTLKECRIRSIVLSQAMAFVHQPFFNRLKARLHLAEFLRFLGFRPILTTNFDLRSTLAVRLLDRLLYFYPSRERCASGVCRRLLLIYGEANRHVNLDRVTHEILYDMVDRGNLTTIAQLQRMAVRRRIVDAEGKNKYLTNENGANINVPITLLQGTCNNLFRATGARRTHEWLLEHGTFYDEAIRGEKFRLCELKGYGHMDVFIGRSSARDVYPRILEALQRT